MTDKFDKILQLPMHGRTIWNEGKSRYVEHTIPLSWRLVLEREYSSPIEFSYGFRVWGSNNHLPMWRIGRSLTPNEQIDRGLIDGTHQDVRFCTSLTLDVWQAHDRKWIRVFGRSVEEREVADYSEEMRVYAEKMDTHMYNSHESTRMYSGYQPSR